MTNEIHLIEGFDLGEDTRWWTARFVKNLSPFIESLAGRPVNYMEVGVFAGITSQWMLENVLTHPDSKLVGIDPWDITKFGENVFPKNDIGKKKYDNMMLGLENLRKKFAPRITWIKDTATNALRHVYYEKNSFDLIYIDGGHLGFDVLMDFALTWPLLKVGGIMIFDDYKLKVKPVVDYIIATLNEFNRSFNKRCRVMFQENIQCGIRKMREF